MTRKIVYFDMDNVLVDFPSAFDHLTHEQMAEFEGRLDEVPRIFSLMRPKEGALEVFEKASEYYDTYILSTAPWKNASAWSDKLLWVQKYLGELAYKRLILSHNKHLNVGDYLVDDRLANGAGKFSGRLLHLSPKSEEEFACEDWNDVLSFLHLDLRLDRHRYNFNDLVLVREAWLVFDPCGIGSMAEYWCEYDNYLDETLDHIHGEQSILKIVESIEKIVFKKFSHSPPSKALIHACKASVQKNLSYCSWFYS